MLKDITLGQYFPGTSVIHRLDPRTKLLMLLTVTSLMLSTGNSGVMNIVKPVLSILPFLLLLTERKWKTAGFD